MSNLNQGASEAELLPCPLCGGTAHLTKGYATENVWSHGEFHRVFCGACQIRQLFHRTAADAIAAWNRRTPAATTGDAELPPLLTDSQIEALWARHADTAKPGERRLAFGRAVERAAIEADRAQLAAKGQGYAVEVKPGEKCPCGQTRDWCIANECKDAAPASAQPADDRQHMSRADMLALCAANPAAASGLPLGAQPDQRESAAVPRVPTGEMIRAGMRYFHDKRYPATEAWRCYKDMLAAAPSPAAQPVARQQSDTDIAKATHVRWLAKNQQGLDSANNGAEN